MLQQFQLMQLRLHLASPTFTGTVTIPTGAVITSPKIASTYSAKTAAYTFASGDEGQMFSMNNAATQQFNIPTDATFNFAVGTEINVFWITGAGQPTIGAVTPGTTTVISTGATSATPKLRVANSGATCKKLAADSWIVFGDLPNDSNARNYGLMVMVLVQAPLVLQVKLRYLLTEQTQEVEIQQVPTAQILLTF
jgi:hypothetical protein